MNTVFELIDGLAPLVGPEGVFTLKVVAWFLTTYYLLVGIPTVLATAIACKLTWQN